MVAKCDDGVLVFDEARRPFKVSHCGVAALNRDEVRYALHDAVYEAGGRIWSADYHDNMSEAFNVNRRILSSARFLRDGIPPSLVRAIGEVAGRPDAKSFGRVLLAVGRLEYGMGCTTHSIHEMLDEAVESYFAELGKIEAYRGVDPMIADPGQGEPVHRISFIQPYDDNAALRAGLQPVGTCEGGVLAFDRNRNPYKVSEQGASALNRSDVNRAFDDALEEAGSLIWPRGYLAALCRVTTIDRRALVASRLAKKGFPPRAARYIGEIAKRPDAVEFGECLDAVASVHGRTAADPGAIRNLLTDVLDLHNRWKAGRSRAARAAERDWRDGEIEGGVEVPEATDGSLAPRM